jgi:hypothetical protein
LIPSKGWEFTLQHHVQTGSGAHAASYPVGTGALSLGVKQLGHEADHSPIYSAEAKECMELYLHPQYNFMVWCLVKHRDKFTFTFIMFSNTFNLCPSLNVRYQVSHPYKTTGKIITSLY